MSDVERMELEAARASLETELSRFHNEERDRRAKPLAEAIHRLVKAEIALQVSIYQEPEPPPPEQHR